VYVTCALHVAVREELEDITAAAGCGRNEVLDLLLRALETDAIVELVRGQRLRDGAARAAWARARHG
jgi:hypothetical protein